MKNKEGFVFVVILLHINIVYAQIPSIGIPVINIVTIDSIMPKCEIIYAPEGCSGVGITHNNYVPGRMTMILDDDTIYDSGEYEKSVSGMRIKRRGNSTGAYLAQHPYKIKLSKKYDLLRRDDDNYKHKEWVLLSMYTWNAKMTHQESNILNVAGLLVSQILQKEWTPEYDFVHVVLNGEYQGLYYLMESVDKGEKRVAIDDTGFLIEHDTFWWNENQFFRTEYQDYKTAYTYKYPDDDNINDSIQHVIQTFMSEFENCLNNHEDISKYINIESFAKWILIHDILGTDDVAGCNRFLCKKDYDEKEPYTSKLEMGPVWDYDSMFRSDTWSSLHTSNWFYFPILFNGEDFKYEYVKLWQNIKPTIKQKIQEGMNTAIQKYSHIFDENIKLHQTKYPNEGKQDFKSQAEEITDKLIKRIDILESLITDNFDINTVDNISYPLSVIQITDLYGQKYTDCTKIKEGIYILEYSNGEKKKVYYHR